MLSKRPRGRNHETPQNKAATKGWLKRLRNNNAPVHASARDPRDIDLQHEYKRHTLKLAEVSWQFVELLSLALPLSLFSRPTLSLSLFVFTHSLTLCFHLGFIITQSQSLSLYSLTRSLFVLVERGEIIFDCIHCYFLQLFFLLDLDTLLQEQHIHTW